MVEVVAIAVALNRIALVLHTLVHQKVQLHVLEAVVVVVAEHNQNPLVDHHVCAPVAPSTHLSTLVFRHASS